MVYKHALLTTQRYCFCIQFIANSLFKYLWDYLYVKLNTNYKNRKISFRQDYFTLQYYNNKETLNSNNFLKYIKAPPTNNIKIKNGLI